MNLPCTHPTVSGIIAWISKGTKKYREMLSGQPMEWRWAWGVALILYYFFFSIFAVLGLLGCAGSALCWGAQASHCGDVSCRGAQALGCGASMVEACGLSGGGSQALERGLNRSCSAACGIFLDQGLNLSSLRWQVDSLPLSHQGSPYRYFLNQPLFL